MTARFRICITRDFLKPDGTHGSDDFGPALLATDNRIQGEFPSENDDVGNL